MKPNENRKRLELKALYTIEELCTAGRLTIHRDTLTKLLTARGVLFLHSGRNIYIPLSEVRDKIPALWESLTLIDDPDSR